MEAQVTGLGSEVYLKHDHRHAAFLYGAKLHVSINIDRV